MELMLFLRVLLRRWWLVLIPVLVVAVVVIPQWLRERSTSGGGYTITLRYTAAQSASNVPPRVGDYQDVWLASELAVNALTDWVRSTSFVNEISKEIPDLDTAGLGVAADNKRSVGQLIMSYPDEKGLASITQAAMDVMKTQAQNYFPQLGGQPAQVTFLDAPVITAAPPPIANRFAPFIRLALGLLGGMALAFLWEYLDPFVYRREQVEAAGLPVLASIPKK